MKLNRIPTLLILTLAIALICACMFMPNILAHLPVTYGTDLKPEQVFFNAELTHLIARFFETGALPFYSWNMFLGTNFYASQSFYIMGDLYTYAGLLLNSMNFFDRTLILEIVKFFVSGLSMAWLLKQMGYSSLIRILGGMAYAFSGWAIFYSGQLMFLSFYTFVPLYLAGIERYLRYGKKFVFLFSTAVLLFSHWYFFYSLSLWTPLYYTWRYFLIRGHFKRFVPETLKLIGVYGIGVGLAGVMFVPGVIYIMDNNRIGLNTHLFYFDQLQVYLHQLVSSFVPNYLYIYRNNIFETNWHVTRELCLWAGSVVGIAAVQFLAFKDKVFRKATALLYLVLLLFLVLPLGNAAMHGFSEPSFRWTFLLTLVNILVACHILEHEDQIDSRFLKISAAVIALICALAVPAAALVQGRLSQLQQYFPQWGLFVLYGVLILIAAAVLMIRNLRLRKTLLLLLATAEFAGSGMALYITSMDTSERGTYEFFDRVTHVLQTEEGQLNQMLDSLDPQNPTQFYRVYVPHDSLYWSYSHNMSIIYQMKGLMTYDSTYAPSLNQLRDIAPQVSEFNSGMIFNIKDPDLVTFLNTKYALVLSEEELPDASRWELIDDDYLGSIRVYLNRDYRPLGTTYHQAVTYEQFQQQQLPLSALNDTVIIRQEDLDAIQPWLNAQTNTAMDSVSYTGNQLFATCTAEEDTFMVITLPYDAGWQIQVNQQTVPVYNVSGGFIGIPLKAGENQILMTFTPQGFKEGALMTLAAAAATVVLFLVERRKKRRHSAAQNHE